MVVVVSIKGSLDEQRVAPSTSYSGQWPRRDRVSDGEIGKHKVCAQEEGLVCQCTIDQGKFVLRKVLLFPPTLHQS